MKTPTKIIYLTFALACFALSPLAWAVDPPPDGGYPGSNTAEGEDALFSLTKGINNTAVGFGALYNDTTGHENTAIGNLALSNNTIGTANTATGDFALYKNTTGYFNTATGFLALRENTTGFYNTATGASALSGNTEGKRNTADGWDALMMNTTGYNNTAIGFQVLFSNTSGNFNTAVGYRALIHSTGSANIALGNYAGSNLTVGDNNIDIGNSGHEGDSDTIRIGRPAGHTATYVAGISGSTVAGGVTVLVDSTGHLGVATSSARYKDEIKPMDKASEAIHSLKPVTFRYKHELDSAGIPQFGLVAEQVEKVNPDLVARDEQGRPYTVRYDAVNAMLLNEFLKEHRTVQELKSIATKQEANAAKQATTIARQQKQIEALIAGLQRVSAQLEASKPALQVVLNN